MSWKGSYIGERITVFISWFAAMVVDTVVCLTVKISDVEVHIPDSFEKLDNKVIQAVMVVLMYISMGDLLPFENKEKLVKNADNFYGPINIMVGIF